MRWVGCRTSRLGWTGRGISRKWPSGLGLGGCWIQSQGVGETCSVQGVQGVALLTGKQVLKLKRGSACSLQTINICF